MCREGQSRERVGVRGKDNKGREVQESGDGMDGGKNGGGREGVTEEGKEAEERKRYGLTNVG